MSPQPNSYVKALFLNVIVHGVKVFKKVIKLHEVLSVGFYFNKTDVFTRRGRDTKRAHGGRKGNVRPSESQEERSHQKPTLLIS